MNSNKRQGTIFFISEITLIVFALHSVFSLVQPLLFIDNYAFIYEKLCTAVPRLVLSFILFITYLIVYKKNKDTLTVKKVCKYTAVILAILFAFVLIQSSLFKLVKDESDVKIKKEFIMQQISISELCNYEATDIKTIDNEFNGAYGSKSYFSSIHLYEEKTTDGKSIENGTVSFTCYVYKALPSVFAEKAKAKWFEDLSDSERYYDFVAGSSNRKTFIGESNANLTTYFSDYSDTGYSKSGYVIAQLDDKIVFVNILVADKNHNLEINEDKLTALAENIISDLP